MERTLLKAMQPVSPGISTFKEGGVRKEWKVPLLDTMEMEAQG